MNKGFLIWVVSAALVACTVNDNKEKGPVLPAVSERAGDSLQIMDVLWGEYRAYFEKDYEAWAAKFVHEDYVKYWGFWEGYPEQVRQYNSWKMLDEDKRKRMEGETKAYWDQNNPGMEMSDINLQIRGSVAWITFRSVSKDMKTGDFLGESLETKILEKVNGEWKIAYLNFLYLPMKQP
jgi:hypothetical protein